MSLFRAVWDFIVAKPIEGIVEILRRDQTLHFQAYFEEPYLTLNLNCTNECDVISSGLCLTFKQKRNLLTKCCNKGQCINVAMSIAGINIPTCTNLFT